MQSVEQFMNDFFRARIDDEQKYQQNRLPFRSKYYAENCEMDGRSGTLERIKSEHVVSIEETNSKVFVITAQKNPFFRKGREIHRLRYTLVPDCAKWLIHCVEFECPFCSGIGTPDCRVCFGRHWCRIGSPSEE